MSAFRMIFAGGPHNGLDATISKPAKSLRMDESGTRYVNTGRRDKRGRHVFIAKAALERRARYNPPHELHQQIFIAARYVPASNFKGSRMSLSLPRFDKRKIVGYDSGYRDVDENARAWLYAAGIVPSALLDLGRGNGYGYAVPWDQLPKVLAAFGIKER